jgi:3-oxoacyl-[acyl-carrier-protein] synthase-3
MGARIESVAARRGRSGPLAPGALQLSDAAAAACLHASRRSAGELDLLVNAGLYKRKNMAEPALASIIQEDIGANPGHPPVPRRHGTFSFDVLNGGCGVVSALHLVDGFVRPGTARLGMVVAADADPGISRGFRFPPVGGAILLAHDDGAEGFARFEFHTFPEDEGLFETRVEFEPPSGHGLRGRRGRSVLVVREDPRFAPRCIALATEVGRGFIERAGLHASDVDLLVASAHPPAFAGELARGLGIAPERLPALPGEMAGAHTAGAIAALAAADRSGALARARNVLLVTAGAGITIALAHYRR